MQGSVKMGCAKAKDVAGRVYQDDALFIVKRSLMAGAKS
ncbi:hypothetical protein SMB34_11185 [Thalassospira permensis NBRC 106175]|uniref:Uncharacterized protein n=1 Tax=Thalassospira permensis NBRC 106175 TaxID=1353532 RepID=A0ABR4TT80_9PROT|nr:hypothetical protein SMB34_11185 [Thalassospira permensis NBRC 106175]